MSSDPPAVVFEHCVTGGKTQGMLMTIGTVDEKMPEKITKGCATVDGNQKSGGNARGEVGS